MSDEKSAATVPNFEQSLTRLDEIARALEDNKLGLQESLGVYEEGVKLLRSCKAMLETAERQVELLTGFDAAGNPVTTPFDDTATIDRSTRTSTSKGSDGSLSDKSSSANLATDSTDVSARSSSTVKKPRKKSPPASDSSSDATSTSSASSSASNSSQLAPWEESPNNSESDNDFTSKDGGDSKIDESGRLF